jgi:hypothetical protein
MSQSACIGLVAGAGVLTWTDSLGRKHDLLQARRISIGEAARKIGVSKSTVVRRIAAGDLYPVVRQSARLIEVYSIGVDDYVARATMRVGGGK